MVGMCVTVQLLKRDGMRCDSTRGHKLVTLHSLAHGTFIESHVLGHAILLRFRRFIEKLFFTSVPHKVRSCTLVPRNNSGVE